jgi:putative transposase
MANYKRIFLQGHSYFFTIVTHRRDPILVDNIALLRESFRESKQFFDYTIDAIVILPDHLHMILTPNDVSEYPRIIKAIKYNFSKNYHNDEVEQSMSRHKREMKAGWQKRYYEHTIRDEKDYQRCFAYIRDNPLKHEYVTDVKEWRYSSFYKT